MTKATTATKLTGKQVATPTVTAVPLSELHFAKDAPKGHNLVVRKSWPCEGRDWDILLASVRQHGVIIPLVFQEIDGKKYVISGNRRLDVLRAIHEGEIATRVIDVPCIDVASYDNGDPRELAYAANIALPPHPVDRYELFAMLVDDGMSKPDLAQRFVLTDRQVSQVLALAALAPEIRDAWRSDEIDADTAQAFTLASSPDDQRKTYLSLKKTDNLHDYSVKQRFVGKQRDIGRTLLFVGKQRYEEAGGKVNEDLFGTDHTVSDQPLLLKLVSERFDAEIKRLTEVDGWAWAAREQEVQNRFSMPSLKTAEPNKAEAAEITKLRKIADTDDDEKSDQAIAAISRIEETAELRGYSAKDRARAGCTLGIGDEGQLVVEYGLLKPAKETQAEARKASGEKPKPKKADGSVLSNALAQRLSQQLTQAAAETIGLGTARVVFAALAAGFATGSIVVVSENGLRTKREGHKQRGNFADCFTHFLKVGSEVALRLVCAQALDFETLNAERPPLKDKGVAALIDELPAKQFSSAILKLFDAKDYFSSCSGAVCAAAIKEIDPKHPLKMKGKAAAEKVAIALAVKHDWLPLFLRTSHYAGPGAKKGK